MIKKTLKTLALIASAPFVLIGVLFLLVMLGLEIPYYSSMMGSSDDNESHSDTQVPDLDWY